MASVACPELVESQKDGSRCQRRNEEVLNILVEAKIDFHKRPGNWVCHR